MTPTPEQVQAAREWLIAHFNNIAKTSTGTRYTAKTTDPHVLHDSLAALLAERDEALSEVARLVAAHNKVVVKLGER